MDWKSVRAEFPALSSWTYLNSATMGHLPRRAEVAAARHLAHRNALACSDFLTWYDDLDRLRGKLAVLFGGTAADYAFFPASAPVLSLLMGGIDWRPGDRVVTLTDEFPNQTYYAALLADRGVELVEAPWEQFYAAIESGRTRVVALSAMSYITGFRPPLAEIAAYLRSRGILFFIDGTQGAGAFHLDMTAIDPDIFVVHGYKWMLAPAGAAFAYFAPRVRGWLAPNVVGWRTHKGWREVNALHQGRPEFSADAERYEGYMQPALLQLMLEASVDLMLEVGPRQIEQRVLSLAAQLRAGLGGGHPDSPIVAVRRPDAGALATRLREQRVIVSARQGYLRVSAHLYNDESDVEKLLAMV
jgi:cysteine desulfurase / selenocysteine lyase